MYNNRALTHIVRLQTFSHQQQPPVPCRTILFRIMRSSFFLPDHHYVEVSGLSGPQFQAEGPSGLLTPYFVLTHTK